MKIALLVPFMETPKVLGVLEDFIPTEADIIWLPGDAPIVENKPEAAQNIPRVLEAMKRAEKDGYNAVVLACLGDPGVEEGRQIVDIPVLGPMRIAMNVCSVLGNRFSIITPSQTIKRWLQQNVKAYGFENCASVRVVNSSAEDASDQHEEYKKSGKYGDLVERVVAECIDAIKEDDATVLTIGCGGLTWIVDIAKDELGRRGYIIPFVDPIPTAIEIAKALVKLRLTQSRLYYPLSDGSR